jgi:uncharacterized protein (DUF427 family)
MSEQLFAAPKTIKVPGPDHPITIERNPKRVVITAAGRVVADTRDALILREASYPAWTYEDPYPAVMLIKDHLAFYPDRVDAIEER